MDHYETLEVSRNASPEVIRAAYKSLMQRLHPDKHPQGETSAGRAAQIAAAYEVLSSPERRAAYDLALRRDAPAGGPVADGRRPVPASESRPAHRRGAQPQVGGARGRSSWATVLASRSGLWWIGSLLAAAAVLAYVLWSARATDPRVELAAIHQAFASADGTEEKRRALFARKLDILAQEPELLRIESAAKAEAMAARTFALLDAPLTVRLGGTLPGGAVAELTIERISLLVGTFDAPRHLAHLAGHRERLVSALAEHLAKADPARLAGPQSELYLKRLLLDAIVTALGTDPAQTYPSTYFESPGRYGVIDLVLPRSFRLVQLGTVPAS